MHEKIDTIDTLPSNKNQAPQFFNVMIMLVYIANGLWALVFLCLFFWSMISAASFAEVFGTGDVPMVAFGVFLLIMEVSFALCIAGARGISNGRWLGFWLFLIGNLPWILINAAGGMPENFLVAAVSVVFIIAFATQFKKLH